MVRKKHDFQPKQTRVQLLDDHLQMLLKKRLAAYQAGANPHLLDQINNMIYEAEIELQSEIEIQQHKDEGKDDGESFVV